MSAPARRLSAISGECELSDDAVTRSVSRPVRRLVFSQSLISLDLIEDFLELSCRAKDEDKVSPYKGTSCAASATLWLAVIIASHVTYLQRRLQTAPTWLHFAPKI